MASLFQVEFKENHKQKSSRHVRIIIANGWCLPVRSIPYRELLKVKVKGKVAGFRPGSRHPFDWPLKRMQKPAEHLLNLD